MSFDKINYSNNFYEENNNFVFDGSILITDSSTGIKRDNNKELRLFDPSTNVKLSELLTEDSITSLGGTDSNTFSIGDNSTNDDKSFIAEIGSANEPILKYNVTTNKWQFSNDGTQFYDIAGFEFSGSENVAFVEKWGSDSTGQPGNPNQPFLTIQGALDSMSGLVSSVYIQMGNGNWNESVVDPGSGSSQQVYFLFSAKTIWEYGATDSSSLFQTNLSASVATRRSARIFGVGKSVDGNGSYIRRYGTTTANIFNHRSTIIEGIQGIYNDSAGGITNSSDSWSIRNIETIQTGGTALTAYRGNLVENVDLIRSTGGIAINIEDQLFASNRDMPLVIRNIGKIDGSTYGIYCPAISSGEYNVWTIENVREIVSWSNAAVSVPSIPYMESCNIYCNYDHATGHGIELHSSGEIGENFLQDVNIYVNNISAKAIETLKGRDTSIYLNNTLRNADLGIQIIDLLQSNRDININDVPSTSPSYRDRIQFNSNLDTVSPPVLMRGGLGLFQMYPESKINDNQTAFQVRLDSTDTWTDVSTGVDLDETITNFLGWVDTNVGLTTQWEYRCTITYDTGQNGETSILIEYSL